MARIAPVVTVLWAGLAATLHALEPSETRSAGALPLYRQEGTDPSFQELLDAGVIVPGFTDEDGTRVNGNRLNSGPVPGSRILVNSDLVERGLGASIPDIPRSLGLHTQVASALNTRAWEHWARWYREDGKTQVFRLFEGEQDIRRGVGENASPGRIEVYRDLTVSGPDDWREWEATYTIVHPGAATVFQLFHVGDLLPAFQIGMNDAGDLSVSHRRDDNGAGPQHVLIERQAVGRNVTIKVRSNGSEYEAWVRDPGQADGDRRLSQGSGHAAEDGKISFRWGLDMGSGSNQPVRDDTMLFVTGIRIK